jgi:hypothetical protein
VVDETKFLGVIFDKKLNFISHSKYVKKKCQKALDLLRVVAHTNWGGDRTTLLSLYRALVRSKLDYGSMVYGSSRPSYIQMLKPIQNQELRLCLRAFRTSAEESLGVEANEPPLALRREKLALQYASKIAAIPSNPAYDCIFNPNNETLFANKPKAIPTFRIKESLETLEFDVDNIAKFQYPDTPPWTYAVNVNLAISEARKDSTDPLIYNSMFKEVKEIHADHKFIYTDGSYKDDKAFSK